MLPHALPDQLPPACPRHAATISIYMETTSPGTADSCNHHSYGTVMTWKKLNHFNFIRSLRHLQPQARRKRVGAGGLHPPNNLLKFFDFVSEKGCKSQGRRNEDSNSHILEEAARIYQKIIFRCHTSQKFQNFHGNTLISHDRLLLSMAHFPKMGRLPRI